MMRLQLFASMKPVMICNINFGHYYYYLRCSHSHKLIHPTRTNQTHVDTWRRSLVSQAWPRGICAIALMTRTTRARATCVLEPWRSPNWCTNGQSLGVRSWTKLDRKKQTCELRSITPCHCLSCDSVSRWLLLQESFKWSFWLFGVPELWYR